MFQAGQSREKESYVLHDKSDFKGQPPASLLAARGIGHPQGVFGVFSYYLLVMF
jgi:hypothetical protein